MRRLFIIGNGFDLACGLPTRYEDFHAFLREHYPNADEDSAEVPWSRTGHHGETLYDDDEVVGFWMCIISLTDGDKWSDFEATLGKLDFGEAFDFAPLLYDKEGDRDMIHEMYNNEDMASQIAGCVDYLPALFTEWVNSIHVSATSLKLFPDAFLRPCTDLFLTFNYTRVLEDCYRIPESNVCHIHGAQGGELVIGHGEGRRFDEEHFCRFLGSEDALEFIQTRLRKDTDEAIQTHSSFFEELSEGVSAIYSYGFSFSKVDEPYLREICARVDTSNLVWYLDDYDTSKHEEYKKTIRRCGFRGHFGTFSTSQIPTIFQM